MHSHPLFPYTRWTEGHAPRDWQSFGAKGYFNIDFTDVVARGSCVLHKGELMWPPPPPADARAREEGCAQGGGGAAGGPSGHCHDPRPEHHWWCRGRLRHGPHVA